MKKLWSKIKISILEHTDEVLIAGCVLVVSGILVSFFKVGLWANLIILLGTFCFGLGFYLKGKDKSKTKLSEYGQFMLGLGALIALPQTPEILDKITEIRDGVNALTHIKELDTGKAKYQLLPFLWKSTNKDEMKNRIAGLVRSKKAKPTACSKDAFDATIPAERKAPTPGSAYLTKEKADKIINSFEGAKPFDRNAIVALVQENLEVWHPKTYPPKCDMD